MHDTDTIPPRPYRCPIEQRTIGRRIEMSSQAIPVQMGRSFGSWRYAVIAALVAVALAVALIVANAGGSSAPGGSGSTTYDGPVKTTTIQVGGGPARFHPLPN
jgi:anti-sigma-K factor RskA